jgi:uncharacterized protein
VQSFVWGSGDPLGQFLTVPSASDLAVHLLVGTLVSSKFVSIFAFLFGLGAALQFRSIRHTLAADPGRVRVSAMARSIYRRRLRFLLGIGLAHGFLLYYGDILAFYALCGFVLVHYLPQRPAQIQRALIWWWLAATVVVGLVTLLPEFMPRGATDDDLSLTPLASLQAFAVYTESGYFGQFALRAADYAAVLESMLIVSVPQIVGLFLLGVLAGRLGWFAHPERYKGLWQTATWIGLLALPIAAYGEWLNLEGARYHPGDPGTVGYFLQFLGSPLACFYVAVCVRARNRAPVRTVVRWIAPAGKMPLTNYLGQSVAMGFLLSGWGLGWGAELNRVELALLALGIVALQWLLSRWWIGRYGRGPMEAWWARATYRPLAGSRSTFNQTPR